MLNQTLTIENLKMPDNFPVQPYENIFNHIKGVSKDQFAEEQFTLSWIALAYRFRTSWENNEEYKRIIQQFGHSPLEYENRYLQERALFLFFVSSLSTIESFLYGLYAIGAMIDSKIFRLMTPTGVRNINLTKTIEAYNNFFKTNINLTQADSGRAPRTGEIGGKD